MLKKGQISTFLMQSSATDEESTIYGRKLGCQNAGAFNGKHHAPLLSFTQMYFAYCLLIVVCVGLLFCHPL